MAQSNKIQFSLLGALGQKLVLQSSTNMVQWVDVSTNSVADGATLRASDDLDLTKPGRFWRARLQ